MSKNKTPIQAVPTNTITGFLGVGKTSAILQLLQQKPANERWAILVNEFGEIGVDGSLFASQQKEEDQSIFIKEVPGGCMCCAAGLPMKVALNQLLKKAKPDRLLIEPTGLGHPKEVLQVLADDYYVGVLNLQKTLTLVDARQLSDERYTNHETFNQQIEIADVVVGNKQDLYSEDDASKLLAYVQRIAKLNTPVIFTQHGKLECSMLIGNIDNAYTPDHHHAHHHKPLASELPMPDTGFVKASNAGEGFYSVGWRFAGDKVFDHAQLHALLSGLKVTRMKAVFITNIGVRGYNATEDGMTETLLRQCDESKIEVIAEKAYDHLEAQLLACLSQAEG